MFDEIESEGHHRVWLCGGGDVAGQALALGRVDEIMVTIAPTVVGDGPSLFDGRGIGDNRFVLRECRAAGGDAVYLHWVRDV